MDGYHQFDPDLPLALYQLIYDFQTIMDHYQIPFFAYGGTLLGAVRHGGLIPWDDDLDCCSFLEHFNDWIMFVAPELVKLGYVLTLDQGDERVFRIISYEGGKVKTALDLFFMRHVVSENRYVCNLPHNTLTDEKVFPLRKLMFGQVNISVPNDYEDFLTNNFGPSWRTHIKKYNHLFGTHEDFLTEITPQDLLPTGPFGPLTLQFSEPIDRSLRALLTSSERTYLFEDVTINFLTGFSHLENRKFWFENGESIFSISSTNSYTIKFNGKPHHIAYTGFTLSDDTEKEHALTFHKNGFSFKHEAGIQEYKLTMPYFIPAELGINSDLRRLSFFLESISLT
ncbi:MAG TPA: hypothetical protein DIC42_05365 [Holosporales bacterium]|nr:hypothetical protein [Holosporales bacterium]